MNPIYKNGELTIYKKLYKNIFSKHSIKSNTWTNYGRELHYKIYRQHLDCQNGKLMDRYRKTCWMQKYFKDVKQTVEAIFSFYFSIENQLIDNSLRHLWK